MSKQTKERHSCRKEVEEETYKEFIRQRVLKYQHQFPRMTEFEIYQKIGREWQAFNLKQKQELYTLYVNNHFLSSQPKVKQQNELNKQIQNKNQRQNIVNQTSLQKIPKIEEQSNSMRTTRSRSKQISQNKGIKQQMIPQNTVETNSKPSPYLQLGQTLSKKLKNLDRNNQQNLNLYKAVFQQVQKQHQKVANIFKKDQIPLHNPVKVEESTKKLKEVKKSLHKIEQQPIEQESSQLSPQEQPKIKKQTIASKSNIDINKQNQRLKLAIRLKIDQSIQNNPKLAKSIIQRSPYLSVKLQEKPNLPKKTSQYLQFYKKGYKKLKQTCSFLTGFEITKILTNLWHKQKAAQKLGLRNNKYSSPQLGSTPPQKKIELSSMLARKIGKINFIKQKLKEQYLPQEAHLLWKNLPLQAKIRWTYPQNSQYQQFIQKQQRPLAGIVRYKSNNRAESHLYDLDWDIFDEIKQEQSFRHPAEQSKLQNQ